MSLFLVETTLSRDQTISCLRKCKMFLKLVIVLIVGSAYCGAADQSVWDPTTPECAQVREQQKDDSYWQRILNNLKNDYLMQDSRFEMDRSTLTFLEEGCDSYEKIKRKEDYACWSEEFICTVKNLVTKTTENSRTRKNLDVSRYTMSWHGWFQPPEGSNGWVDAWKQDNRHVISALWLDPKLGVFAGKFVHNAEKSLLERVMNYIRHNNIESLNQLFDMYNNVRSEIRSSCDDTAGNSMCKFTWLFDRLEGLMNEYKNIPYENYPPHPPPRAREELAMFYVLKPKVYEAVDMDSAKNQEFLIYRLRTLCIRMYDTILSKDGDSIKRHFGRYGSIIVDSRTECDNTLNKDFSLVYCQIAETFDRMTKLTQALGPGYDNWESKEAMEMRAVMLVWLLITPFKIYTEHGRTVESKFQSATALLKIMYARIHSNEVGSLQQLSEYMPTSQQMLITTAKDCAPNFDSIKTDLSCNFHQLIQNVALFLNQYKAKDEWTKNLDLSVDHKEKLQLVQIENVQSAVETAKLEIKSDLLTFTEQIKAYTEKTVGGRFGALETYLNNLANFDKEIANADIGFITGKLNTFREKSVSILNKLEVDVTNLQVSTEIFAGIEAAFLWMKAAGSAITAIMGAMTGDFDGFADAADRVDAAAKATVLAAYAGSIKPRIQTITTQTLSAITKLTSNEKFLSNTGKIITQLNGETNDAQFQQLQTDFIAKYNEYTPEVNPSDIAAMNEVWDTIIEGLEMIIGEITTKEALFMPGVTYSKNYIGEAKVAIAELMALLSARFDYQDDLMAGLARAVRANIASRASTGLHTNFQGLEGESEISAANTAEAVALEQMALSTYIMSQLHSLIILVQYCDELTYVNAGESPSQCGQALTSLLSSDISAALSLQPPSCDKTSDFLNIPTSEIGRLDAPSLQKLYSGEEVAFQVTSSQWLVDHNWISTHDTDKAFYVKAFDVILPLVGDQSIRGNIRVEIYPDGAAPLYRNDVKDFSYKLGPKSRVTYVSEYREQTVGGCADSLEDNPYAVCEPGPGQICFRSKGILPGQKDVYPSIYSRWIIKVSNLENIKPPNPPTGTEFSLKARLELCRKTKDTRGKRQGISRLKKRKLASLIKHHSSYKRTSSRSLVSCPGGQYYDQNVRVFSACPAESTPGYHSYYCEKNPIEDSAVSETSEDDKNAESDETEEGSTEDEEGSTEHEEVSAAETA